MEFSYNASDGLTVGAAAPLYQLYNDDAIKNATASLGADDDDDHAVSREPEIKEAFAVAKPPATSGSPDSR